MVDLLNLHGGRRTPFVAQTEAAECGLACLAMIAGFHGLKTDILALRQRYSVSSLGMSLNQLLDVSERLGFVARPLRGDMSDLEHLSLPAILHWDLSHFVVLSEIRSNLRGREYIILDPARGRSTLSEAATSQHFTGVAVEFLKTESFRPQVEETRLKITQLWSSMVGFWPTFGTIVALSLVMQTIVLVAPFFSQIAIDHAFPAGDRDLLGVLAAGFLMLAVVSLVATWLRSLVIVALNNALSYQVVVNLYQHLSRLPLPWFERRHVGDIVSRFGSTAPIAQLLSQGLVAALVDGLMAILTVVLMFVYSVQMTFIALGAFLLYLCLRLAFLQALRLRNVDVITTAARENSLFIETVRGMSAIKAFGQEANRQRTWQQAKADAVNAQVKLGRLTGAFDSLAVFIPAAERVVFIAIAVGLALDGSMTIGMIFAFQAYKQQFLDAGIRLVEQLVNYRILHVHLARISDIALSKPEVEASDRRLNDLPDLNDGFSVKDIRFRYGTGDPEILRGVRLDIKPGEMVALVGPSGGGKTTLMKIMMGLLEPTAGSVFVGDVPLSSYSKMAWRRSIGVVAQDDVLFAGSLADNIAFFDPNLDMSRVEDAARQSAIHEDILGFPMGYDTLVGDMGSVLSGGQKQRVLIARALYRQPRILFLDEGTSQLDPVAEAAVLKTLKELPIIRIVVAHRSQSVEAADRVMLVASGRVMPVKHPRHDGGDRPVAPEQISTQPANQPISPAQS